jgi:hypothetical protein
MSYNGVISLNSSLRYKGRVQTDRYLQLVKMSPELFICVWDSPFFIQTKPKDALVASWLFDQDISNFDPTMQGSLECTSTFIS